ncbi:MAG: hypothetical protein A2896_02950 [Candidatus Nealsonbacteria bacterium RIFCSPLOWO2_01_FULL_43_32]|uniref:Uncharacterized protein n=1 Tax=Candidatus Nealsonbacteria bacterium RIFCSPLOWO2_01_FULL_43_32 TaxID=1801672 RepID=A0A1G2EEW1_9BACT|nr:MAG: hypothetical protein A2896_02950 [Candidatus Nealsonbacteria bacterium RIFCSPLOWO2_01_FULL_43_32]
MECLICNNDIEDTWWPICANPACLLMLTELINHKETPCWISQEIYCQREYCVGPADVCRILQGDMALRKQGLRKSETVLGCWY